MTAFSSLPSSVQLVAVSKTQPLSKILRLMSTGVTHFGESRVEEIEEKWSKVPSEKRKLIQLHMIGHVQSRKAQRVAELCDWVDSVDSLKLATKLNEYTGQIGKQLKVLVQVNTSGEEQKYGYQPAELEADLLKISELENLRLRGLMTIAPLTDDPQQTRPAFRKLAELRKQLLKKHPQLSLEHLSMGMTNDYRIALEEGTTMIRIGRGVFNVSEK